MKCTYLVSLSTTTRMADFPCGSASMKSMAHTWSGIGSGCRRPAGLVLVLLADSVLGDQLQARECYYSALKKA